MEQIEQFSQKMLAKDSVQKGRSMSINTATDAEINQDDMISDTGSVSAAQIEGKKKNNRNQIQGT